MSSQKYEYFNIKKSVNVLVKKSKTEMEVSAGYIYFQARFQRLLLCNKNLYKELGFLDMNDIYAKLDVTKSRPTVFKLYSQSNASRLSFIETFNLFLNPRIANVGLYPYNERFKTSIAYAKTKGSQQAAETLYSWVFEFGPPGKTVEYIVEPTSRRGKRSKRTAPTFSSSFVLLANELEDSENKNFHLLGDKATGEKSED